MRYLICVATVFLIAIVGFAREIYSQSANGSVTGIISSGANGAVLSGAGVQVKNVATSAFVRTISKSDGAYTLTNLPPGTYEISVNMPCCAFQPFVKSDVVVSAGAALKLNITLKEGGSLNTLGDDPGTLAAMVRKRSVVNQAAAPRTRDGKPDLSGVWLTNRDLYPERPDALPWAAALAKERLESNLKDHPHTQCLPGSPPVDGQTTPFMAKFVHTPSLLVILTEGVPGHRQIFLDGRKHPADPDPSWVGHSIGKWEGDTLVIDTIGFNDRGWMEVYPRTEKLHIVERYRRVDFGHLAVQVIVEDPGVFAKPWHMNMGWDLAPQEELMEYVCENNKAQNMVGK
jgi:hypothetical protein